MESVMSFRSMWEIRLKQGNKMKIIWDVTEHDIRRLTKFCNNYKNNSFVSNRIKRNTKGHNITLNKDIFWKEIVACLLTSQQKSGPNSAISRFLRENPFPLSLSVCQKKSNLNSFAEEILSQRKGIRFPTKIGSELAYNMIKLTDTRWEILSDISEYYNSKENTLRERKLAEQIDDLLKGFGPKQSRNLLQSLGITKFEIPIDSRITKWLNEFGFPLRESIIFFV